MNTTQTVRIRIPTRLSERLVESLDGLTIASRAASTELVGELTDQTQLFALLTRIRDLGLPIESVSVQDSLGVVDRPPHNDPRSTP